MWKNLWAIMAGVGLLSMPVQAAVPAPAQKSATEKQPSKAQGKPFRGKIKTVDTQTRVIVLTGAKAQTFQITAETKIFKDDRPATFADLAVGESVTGYAREKETGKWEARTLYQGQHSPKK